VLKKFSVVDGGWWKVIIVSALSQRKRVERERELDNKTPVKSIEDSCSQEKVKTLILS